MSSGDRLKIKCKPLGAPDHRLTQTSFEWGRERGEERWALQQLVYLKDVCLMKDSQPQYAIPHQVLGVVASVSLHHILGMVSGDFVVDGGILWVLVRLSQPPDCACAVSPVEGAWEWVGVWIVPHLDLHVN